MLTKTYAADGPACAERSVTSAERSAVLPFDTALELDPEQGVHCGRDQGGGGRVGTDTRERRVDPGVDHGERTGRVEVVGEAFAYPREHLEPGRRVPGGHRLPPPPQAQLGGLED